MKNLYKFSLLLLFVVGISLALFSISRHEDGNDTSVYSTKLYLNWIYSGAFAGEIVASNIEGHANGINIDLIEGGQGKDPLKLVKDNMFGIASADEIISAIDKGADYKIIGVVNDDNPTVFVSLIGSNIKTPYDFIGKRVGLLPYGSTGLIYQAMLDKLKIDRSKINEVVVTPDLKTFIVGKVNDVQPAFIFDEPVTLDELKVKYNTIIPKDYGVSYKGACYFTTSNTIVNNPELVKKFIFTMIKSWKYALNNPEKSISEMKKLSGSINEQREINVLNRGVKYYDDGKRHILDTNEDTWADMLNQLLIAKQINRVDIFSNYGDLSFVRKYYSDSK